jgi:hypothetical protein
MEQGYYSKDRTGYYREGFLAHGSISSKVFYTTWHWGSLMSAFGGIADKQGQIAYLPPQRLTQSGHWLCTAAMVLMLVSAPYRRTRLSR